MKTLIVGVINAKGGVAKTTTAIHLAAALAPQYTVEVWDADPQGSATIWASHATEDGNPLPFEVKPANVPSIKTAQPQAQIVIIDAPPQYPDTMNAIAERADLCIVPTAPSGMDMQRVIDTLNSIPANTSRIVLLTAADPRTILYRETREMLEEEKVAVFEQEIRSLQGLRSAYGTNPKKMFGYDEVARELIELMGMEGEA